jgi:hypothetical protein
LIREIWTTIEPIKKLVSRTRNDEPWPSQNHTATWSAHPALATTRAPSAGADSAAEVGPFVHICLAKHHGTPRRSRATTPASRLTTDPSSAMEPAVVLSRSRVAMLSLSSTGTPCRPPICCQPAAARRSASAFAASSRASGFISITAWSSGLRRLIWPR